MPDVNVLALYKGGHRYVFVYDDASREETLAAIRDTAADPAAVLNWFDAAVLAERLAEQSPVGEAESSRLPELGAR